MVKLWNWLDRKSEQYVDDMMIFFDAIGEAIESAFEFLKLGLEILVMTVFLIVSFPFYVLIKLAKRFL